MIPQLRDYQQNALVLLGEAIRAGHRRNVLVAPTGAGKTTIAGAMVKGAADKGNGVLFVAHRTELIKQASARFDAFGIPHGIIQAGTDRANRRALVQVASVQTLGARHLRKPREDAPRLFIAGPSLPDAKLLIVDEAHRTMGETYLRLLAMYPHATVIGLTATPVRMDGQGLGDVYTNLVEAARIEDLVAQGVLMAPRVFAPPGPDLRGVKTTAGDYNAKGLAIAMDKSKLVGDIVAHQRELAAGKRTVVFASSVAHSLHIRDAFRAEGVDAEHIDGETHELERATILARLEAGTLEVVVNCNVLTEGWDCPPVACCVLARPTKSLGMYIQMVGRVLRTFPGKPEALVLDHAGCTHEHGLVTEPRVWELSPSKKGGGGGVALKTCPSCYAIADSRTLVCGECGHNWPEVAAAKASESADLPETEDGQLIEVTSTPRRLAAKDRVWAGYLPPVGEEMSLAEKQALYDALAEHALAKGWKPGFARMKFFELVGNYPPKVLMYSSRLAAELEEAKAARAVGL